MIVVNPDNAASALPAGCYALVIKGPMFDFTSAHLDTNMSSQASGGQKRQGDQHSE
jgi:hypothetical protein